MRIYRPSTRTPKLAGEFRCAECLRDKGFTEDAIALDYCPMPCRHHMEEPPLWPRVALALVLGLGAVIVVFAAFAMTGNL